MLQKARNPQIDNIGYLGAGRRFPGFPEKSETLRRKLAPRGAVHMSLAAGDVVSLLPATPDQTVAVVAFSESGDILPDLLGLAHTGALAWARFDDAPLRGWIARHGGSVPDRLACTELALDALAVLRAHAACDLWLIRPQTAADLVASPSLGTVDVVLKSASAMGSTPLPPPLGRISDEFVVPRASALAYELRAGQFVQIIDIEGQQCSDFMALRSDALERGVERGIDGTATRSMVRSAYPGPGLLDKFYDADQRPILRAVQDTCGRHDMFGLACNARGYADRGFPGHVNCSDNMSDAYAPFGVERRAAWPAVNFFWNTWLDPQTRSLMTEESHSRPGDYVTLQALTDLVCVSTACPDDIDPINGWNPTDVQVRIYEPDAPIHRAVAFREKEDAPMSISAESAFHPATSKLTQHYAPARDVWAPVSYPSVGTIGEYWACREAVTLQDMSALRKYDIVGPDAERLLQSAMTRDIARLSVWRGTYALICDEIGHVVDDGTLFRLSTDLFRWCCGSEESARVLEDIARRDNLQVRINAMDGALPNLALQGPKSRALLRKIVFTQPTHPSLDDVTWFGVTIARLGDRDGLPFMLSRSGYTGELGYELFCAAADAPALWDALMEAGQEFGITPMGSDALEIIRIEAGLASRAEFASGGDAHEAGLSFAISPGKTGFTGQAALARNGASPRQRLMGLKFAASDVPAHGSHVYVGERPVGIVTSATRSPCFECAIALARVSIEYADVGTAVDVGQLDGHMKRLPATVCAIPFVDPKRERARA